MLHLIVFEHAYGSLHVFFSHRTNYGMALPAVIFLFRCMFGLQRMLLAAWPSSTLCFLVFGACF